MIAATAAAADAGRAIAAFDARIAAWPTAPAGWDPLAERRRLAGIDALERVGRAALAAGDHAGAGRCWRRVFALRPGRSAHEEFWVPYLDRSAAFERAT